MKHTSTIVKIATLAFILSLLCLFYRPSSINGSLDIYRIGTKFMLTATWWGVSADGTMEALDKVKFKGKDTILVRSHVTRVGGLLGFIVRFLRIYKESNTFDSYIDLDTLMPVRYEVYRLNKDGSKRLNEDIYFDRKLNRIVSLEDDSIVINNAPPDAQDAFSTFLSLLRRFNTEKLFVGKKFYINLYAYKKVSKVEVEVTALKVVNDKPVYTLEIKELPDIFKHPASITFEVADNGNGFNLPTKGRCTIDVPALPDINIDGELKQLAGYES